MFDREATLARVRSLAGEAARKGARLVLFPEAFVSAYPRGLDFGAVVGARTEAGRDDFRRYWDSSVEVPGPAVDRLARDGAAHAIYLVIGVVERDGGTLYCTVLFFAPDGAYLGKHRKLMPTASERLVWGFGDGSTLPVFDTPLGRLGAVICWENYLPLLRATMYAKGIEIYCAPTADPRDSWLASMQPHRGRGPVLRAVVQPVQPPPRLSDDYPVALRRRSGRRDHRGRQLHRRSVRHVPRRAAHYDGEAILTAEIDPAQIVRGKFDLDVVGHYARPDIFQLHVDERPKPPVTIGD